MKKGFTLIELLLVVALLAVLAVIIVVIYRGIVAFARDSERKADVDAIAKAYEVKYTPTTFYPTLTLSDFTGGSIPKPPEGGDYYNVRGSGGAGFKVCATLEGYPNTYCNSASKTCYCRSSTQKPLIAGDDDISGPGYVEIGYSGSAVEHPSSCDQNGTLDDGLIGYWKFDEGSWTDLTPNEVKDSSGNNYHGTPIGAIMTSSSGLPAIFKNAASFNNQPGTGNLIEIPDATQMNNLTTFSYSMWFNYTDSSRVGTLLDKNRKADTMATMGSDRKVVAFVAYDPTSAVSLNNTTLQTNQWYHLVTTFNNVTKTTTIYLNSQSSQFTAPGNGTLVNDDPYNLILGNQHIDRAGAFPGLLDDVRIYNRVLSKEEVQALYNGGNGCLP